MYDTESTLVWLQRRREGLAVHQLRDSEPVLGAYATGRVSVGGRDWGGEWLSGCFAGMQSLLSPEPDHSRWAAVLRTASELGPWP